MAAVPTSKIEIRGERVDALTRLRRLASMKFFRPRRRSGRSRSAASLNFVSIGEAPDVLQQKQSVPCNNPSGAARPPLRAIAGSDDAAQDWDPTQVRIGLLAEIGAAREAVVVMDGLISNEQQRALMELLCDGDDATSSPPAARWDQRTLDAPGLPPSWGFRHELLGALERDPPPAVLQIQARLSRLYPEYRIVHMPSHDEEAEEAAEEAPRVRRANFVANAAIYGDTFQWHVDADPCERSTAAAADGGGAYANGALGRPLFVSLVVYCNSSWRAEWDAETLFVDPASGVGLLVQPRPGRAVLMHQDVLHRLSTPSQLARRPRYSLVWKLLFVPRRRRVPGTADESGGDGGMEDEASCVGGSGGGGGWPERTRETILRPEWGEPLRMGVP